MCWGPGTFTPGPVFEHKAVTAEVTLTPEGRERLRQQTASDPVNHPSHYTAHPSGVECIQITEHMNFNLGNATKYIWRAGLKSRDPIQDLEKARWYLDREIQRLNKEKQP